MARRCATWCALAVASVIGERAALCEAGRTIDGYGCFTAPDGSHVNALDRVRDLRLTCIVFIRDHCAASHDPDSWRYDEEARMGACCPAPTS
ncbi:MAG: hypothetical protein AAGN82_05755 [Myxococcota bacterium]